MVYVGQIPLDTDWLFPQRAAMVGLASLSQAILGAQTVVDGLEVVPASPAALSVVVQAGQIYSMAAVDPLAYGSLAAVPGQQVLKQGLIGSSTLALNPPGTAGYTQVFLIQAAYQDKEDGAVVLPYYNSADPSVAWSGPGNSGQQQFTRRLGVVTLQIKAGVPAPTGSQQRPEPDPGYVGLAWVSVAAGQLTITATNITPYTSTNRLPIKLPQLTRAVGAKVQTVNSSRQLTAEDAGVVIVDVGTIAAGAEIRLPAISSLQGIPMKFTFHGRYVTPRVSQWGWAKILPSGSDQLDHSYYYCGPLDSVEVVSDGNSRWFMIGSRATTHVLSAASTDQVIPNNVETSVNLAVATQANPNLDVVNPSFPSRINIKNHGRYRISGNVQWEGNGAGQRQARIVINGVSHTGGLGFSAVNAAQNLPTGQSLSGGPFGLYDGNFFELRVYQNSGGPVALAAVGTWVALEYFV